MFLININNSSVKASDIQLTLYYIIRLDPSVCILLSDQTGNTYIAFFVLTLILKTLHRRCKNAHSQCYQTLQ